MTSLSFWGIFSSESYKFNDYLYQKTSLTNPKICIIGIDATSIEELGSFPFDRKIFADVINILNDQEQPPIAIGLDVLFTGETNSDSDSALIQAVEDASNVILACSANYSNELIIESFDHFYISKSHLTSMNYPFPDLLEVANLGHINSALDSDGILRHAILSIESTSGETVPALNLAMYQKYCDFYHISTGELPNSNWYLPFTSKTGGYYDGYSLNKVLTGEIPPSVFQNKLVLIGPYTMGLQDHFFTAIDHTNLMYGVEYQANALEILINQNFIHEIPQTWNLTLLFTSCFCLFLLTYQKKLRFNTLILLSSTLLFLSFCKLSYGQGYLWQAFYFPFSLFFLYITNIVLHAVTSTLEKARVTATFKRYVAPEVVEQIMKEGTESLKLGGKTTEVSVMFIDIRNFTPMSEKFPPEVVIDILNRFLNKIAETIMENGGTLDKFIGDAIMCFWGAPLPQEDYIHRSVETALQIIENIQPIAVEVQKTYEHEVAVGIGIQCGSAVVGNIGSQNRMDFTVIGDTVNTAARLESNAKPNTINVSHDIFTQLEGKFTFDEIEGGLTLKGKVGKFVAYRVSRKKDFT